MFRTNQLRRIMGERKLSFRQLARMSGVSLGVINQIERCEEDPKQSTMIAISRALKLEVTEVFNLNWRK